MKVLYQSPNYRPEIITNRYLYINLNTGKPVVNETVKTRKSNYTYREYELPEADYPHFLQAIEEAKRRKMLFPFEVELRENAE